MTIPRVSALSNERPGVYGGYVVQSLYQGKEGSLPVGLLCRLTNPDTLIHTLSSLAEAARLFPEEEQLHKLLGILFAAGVSTVHIRGVEDAQGGYESAARALLDTGKARVLLTDCASSADLGAVLAAMDEAALAQRETVALCGIDGVDDALTLAGALNHERLVCCVGKALPAGAEGEGKSLFAAAALAGVLATMDDPSASLNGASMPGLASLSEEVGEADIQRMLRGGVTPFEIVGGSVACIKPISTKTKTGGVPDRTWRSIQTVMTIDYVMRHLRAMLALRLKGAKNNLATRESIRTQVALELSTLCQKEILDDFGPPRVIKSQSDPGVCEVELSFKLSGVMDRMVIAAYITL